MDIYADPPVGTTASDLPPMVKPYPLAPETSEVIAMRPDVTKIQVIALVQAVIGLLTAFGLDLSVEQRDAILELVGQLGVALILGDAVLRGARNLSDRDRIKP